MEIGVPDVKGFIARKSGHSLINLGPRRVILQRVPRLSASRWR